MAISQRFRPQFFNIDPFAPLARGLVFAGLGCAPGTFFYKDSSRESKGNDGTLTGYANDGGADSPTKQWQFIPELGRWALGFDGSDDYVGFTTYPRWFPIGTTPMSAMAWVNPTTAAGAHVIWGFGKGTYYKSFGAYVTNDNSLYVWLWGTGDYDTGVNLVGGAWTHVAVVHFGGVVTTYVNGVSIDSRAKALNVIAGFGIGADTIDPGATSFWKGLLADVNVWSRALSVAEIRQLADPSNVMLSGLIKSVVRKTYFIPPVGGIVIPVMMHHYKMMRSA